MAGAQEWTRAQEKQSFQVRRAGRHETLVVSPISQGSATWSRRAGDHGVLGVRPELGSPSSKGRRVGEGMGRSSPPAAPAPRIQGVAKAT